MFIICKWTKWSIFHSYVKYPEGRVSLWIWSAQPRDTHDSQHFAIDTCQEAVERVPLMYLAPAALILLGLVVTQLVSG